MTKSILILLSKLLRAVILCLLCSESWAERILGTSYSSQQGTQYTGTTVTYFDSGDYVTYSSVNFGEPGATKAIVINYSKQGGEGKVEIRLGGPTGDIIVEFPPAWTGSWYNYSPATIGIENIHGIHDLTFVGGEGSNIFYLAWFELSALTQRASPLSRIATDEYSNQNGVAFGTTDEQTYVRNFENGDFITYTQINFGEPGTTKGILVNYANPHSVETGIDIRLGDATGEIIATFSPANTGSWRTYHTAYIGIDDVDGIHDLTFQGSRGIAGISIMYFDWFELSDFAERAVEFSRIEAYKYSTQKGTQILSGGVIGYFDNDDFVTYSNINFGDRPSTTTNSILMNYARGVSTEGNIEVRLGGPTGTIIADFLFPSTGGWDNYQNFAVSVSGFDGVHNLTFVGRGEPGLMNLKWFELSDEIVSCGETWELEFFHKRSSVFPNVDVFMTCYWLGKLKRKDIISNICRSTNSAGGKGPAREVCTETCGTCSTSSLTSN